MSPRWSSRRQYGDPYDDPYGGYQRRGMGWGGGGFGRRGYGGSYSRPAGGGCLRDACLLEGGCCLAEALGNNCLLAAIALLPQFGTALIGGPQRQSLQSRLVAAIRIYQRRISPQLAGRCRFTPSCSEYAAQSLLAHGSLRGSWLAVQRLVRCRPGGARGANPVPGGVPTSPRP